MILPVIPEHEIVMVAIESDDGIKYCAVDHDDFIKDYDDFTVGRFRKYFNSIMIIFISFLIASFFIPITIIAKVLLVTSPLVFFFGILYGSAMRKEAFLTILKEHYARIRGIK